MEQKTINQNKLQTILCIIALTLGVLVSAVLFSMPPVHAEESTSYSHTYTLVTETRTSNTSNYTSREDIYSTDLQFVLVGSNTFTEEKKIYNLYAYIKNDRFPDGTISIINDSLFSGLFDWDVTHYKNGEAINTFHNDKNQLWFSYTESTVTDNTGVTVTRTIDTSVPMFDTYDHALAYCRNGDEDGWLNKPETPNTADESYTFTGFSINGKTARWTGTTERSHLKDQEVEEYTTITYAWATTTEPDNIGTFQEYDGEFPTSAKQLKLPWSDMESGKVDFQFIRQVNIIPCYRVTGAFYHGQAVKIFFKPDGTIEKISDPNVSGVLDKSIPIPILSVDNDQGTFVFTNAQNDYKFELKGRFWSTDDFYVYRNTPSLVWQYKYLTLLKNSLTTWVSVGDNKSVLDTFSFGDLGSESWQDLLNTYPIDQRNIITGQEQGWFSWANITGYNDAVSTLKMLLNSPYSLFNGYEIYVRYYVVDSDGIVKYSKWTHYFNNLANADGSTGSIVDDADNMNNGNQSDKGLTDNDLNNVENSGNSRNDVDTKSSSDFGSVDIGDISGIFNQFLSVLKGLYSGMGQLPSFINAIFGFLPAWVTTMIGVSIVIIIFLRILGR